MLKQQNVPEHLKKYLSSSTTTDENVTFGHEMIDKKKKKKKPSSGNVSGRETKIKELSGPIIKDFDDDTKVTNSSSTNSNFEDTVLIDDEKDNSEDEMPSIDNLSQFNLSKSELSNLLNKNKPKKAPKQHSGTWVSITPSNTTTSTTTLHQEPTINRKDDLSPPINKRDGDLSPPRNRRDDDLSPPRNRNNDDLSPPRKRNNDDLSPPKNRNNDDLSPPRKRTFDDADLSPPRNSRNDDLSPPRNRGKKDESPVRKSSSVTGNKKFKGTDEELGKNASPIYRDKHGRKLDQSDIDKMEKDKLKETEFEWGKTGGYVQKEKQDELIRRLEEEKSKPFARYANDKDLNDHLKNRDLWGDPMAFKKSSSSSSSTSSSSKGASSDPNKPRYKGSYPPNRYGIAPGHRWDGVNRSNGFESILIAKQNEMKDRSQEAYYWSVEDM
ncbi:hypothetical protein DLAC_00867 [Tieghemostelium lacteum]|uniref:BUD13 homolog n=1 Tax=Tieghemostelium lacteum TaxID=361077 RepID=A0A152A770_TIELA|nr:hypothetical protein DLAC_00867 [Tieghemostelium lacteum]|eukprot:KYR02068.1 hypothetical protein DLAC_00867 [Tieghemostelium lacteum]